MKKILIVIALTFGSLSAYEPIDWNKYFTEKNRQTNEMFDRIENRIYNQDQNRIQNEILREMQKQNRYPYGR